MKHLERGCGSVGTEVDSDPRDPGSKPVICKFYLLSNVMKRQQLGKRGREWTKLETNLAFYTLSIALPIQIKRNYDKKIVGSSCGSVGKAVASDSRGPRFKSSHSQNLC